MILVSREAHDDDFFGEWVSVHELSHLLIPPVDRDQAWLSEGLASYMQQILRAREGLISESDAWAGLVDGFDRARRRAHENLGDAAQNMEREHGFVDVYWGGAAILFNLDVALRQHGSSLDSLLAKVREREPVDVAFRSADAIVDELAADAPPDVDVRAIVRDGLARPFPDVDASLQALGIRPHDDNAPLASLRKAIVRRDDSEPPNVVNSRR
jgi:predicted metalloprotease with PDZ domain